MACHGLTVNATVTPNKSQLATRPPRCMTSLVSQWSRQGNPEAVPYKRVNQASAPLASNSNTIIQNAAHHAQSDFKLFGGATLTMQPCQRRTAPPPGGHRLLYHDADDMDNST